MLEVDVADCAIPLLLRETGENAVAPVRREKRIVEVFILADRMVQ